MHACQTHLPVLHILPTAHILHLHPFFLCQSCQFHILPVRALRTDRRQYQAPQYDSLRRIFFQHIKHGIAVIAVRMGDKNRFQLFHPFLLQIGQKLIFRHTALGGTPSVNEIMPPFSAADMNTVSLSHIQHGNLQPAFRPEK